MAPLLVTRQSLRAGQHSGAPSFAVSFDDLTILTWTEVEERRENIRRDPRGRDRQGSPVFVTSFNPVTNSLGDRHLIAYSQPGADDHNVAGMVADSEGIVHLVTGAHNRSFYYVHSLAPRTADAGWTKPQPTITGDAAPIQQTYAAFERDQNNTMHLVFRQGRRGETDAFNGGRYEPLVYQQKRVGEPWSPPMRLVVPPAGSVYSIYYHKLGSVSK
jgi:hypothetical protein